MDSLRDKLAAVKQIFKQSEYLISSDFFFFYLSKLVFIALEFALKVGKESSELSRELQALEKQSSATDHSAGLVSEALQLYDQNSVHDLFQG